MLRRFCDPGKLGEVILERLPKESHPLQHQHGLILQKEVTALMFREKSKRRMLADSQMADNQGVKSKTT
jgi:hypothetical protein